VEGVMKVYKNTYKPKPKEEHKGPGGRSVKPRTELAVDVADLELSKADLLFIGIYATNGFDAIDALKKAKLAPVASSEAELRINAHNLLCRRDVKIAVQRLVNSVIEPFRDTLEVQILTILNAQITTKPSDFFNSDGSVKPLDSIELTKQHAITGIKKDIKNGAEIVNYELANKHAAIKLAKEVLQATKPGEDANIPAEARSKVRQIMEIGANVLKAKEAKQPKPEVEVTYSEEEIEE
jgi:hypothetical protein